MKTEEIQALTNTLRAWDAAHGVFKTIPRGLATAAADALEAQAGELQAWKRECGPLLDYLTGSDLLCESPVDYAKELYERIEAQEREIARLRTALMRICPVEDGYTEHFDDLVDAGLLVEAPSDERYRELWGEDEATMWVWAWSPLANKEGDGE